MLATLLSVDVESKLQLAMVGVYSPKIQTCITLSCSKYLVSTYQLFVVLRRYPLVLLRILLRTRIRPHYGVCIIEFIPWCCMKAQQCITRLVQIMWVGNTHMILWINPRGYPSQHSAAS